MKYILILLILFSFSGIDLKAQATCTGNVCNTLGPALLGEVNDLGTQFQYQYLNKLSKTMGIAGSNANLGSSMIGLGSLNRFEVGGGISASLYNEGETSVVYKSTYIDKLPNSGFGITPAISGGVNLGWLLREGPAHYEYIEEDEEGNVFKEDEDGDETVPVAPNLLHRINIYAHGVRYGGNINELKSLKPSEFGISGDFAVSGWGVNLRFLLIAPDVYSFLFRFMGLSVGVGFNKSLMTLDLSNNKKNNTQITIGPYIGRWVGDTTMKYDLNARTTTFDIRSGFRLLKVLTFFGGVGYAKQSTDVVLEFGKKGPLTISVDPSNLYYTAFLNSSVYQNLGSIAAQEGILDVSDKTYGKYVFGQGFGIFGMEINIFSLQIFSEFYFTGYRGGTGNFGVKMSF
ncbi:MAG: hypothetical protein KDK36_18130 [Leptospiraceae bacterium]|nr:hypothetical protein [Leptospiraceae bacterium]